jgi:hypothetical protein
LEIKSPLFNCTSFGIPENFLLYYYKEDIRNLFDQFMISRSMLFNISKLEMQFNEVQMFNENLTIKDLPIDG